MYSKHFRSWKYSRPLKRESPHSLLEFLVNFPSFAVLFFKVTMIKKVIITLNKILKHKLISPQCCHGILQLNYLMSSTEGFELYNKTIWSIQSKYLKSSIEVFEVFDWSIWSLQLKYLKSLIEVIEVFNWSIWSL